MTTPEDSARPLPLRRPATTMRAVTRRRYGGVEQVAVEEVPCPEPAAGQVLIEVAAAGLDRAVPHLLTGTPLIARAAFGLRAPRQPVLGMEVCGRVVALGAGVGTVELGQRVLGVAAGSFAEYAVGSAAQFVGVPDALSDVEAATLPISAGTAFEAAVTQAQVVAGQRVLVLGASGGVGSFAVRLAAHLGAEVTAMCSSAKAAFVADLGAEVVADYRAVAVAELAGPFDAIIDIAGNRPLRELRAVLAPRGVLVIVGGESGGRWLGGLHRNLGASLLNPVVGQRLLWFTTRQSEALHRTVAELAATGAMRPAVDRVVGLENAADAIGAMLRGELRGKAVIRP
ncbi:MAG: NAD(P)-dependent alcohol dehydrogenase [Phycicoccus sp.]|nr:NAD(P)-dependent alcohol dehydrogenase [Phycicoccus sp.]